MISCVKRTNEKVPTAYSKYLLTTMLSVVYSKYVHMAVANPRDNKWREEVMKNVMMLEEQEVVERNKGKNVMVLDEQEVEKNVTVLEEQEVVEMIVTNVENQKEVVEMIVMNVENQQEVVKRNTVEKKVKVVEMKERN